ncbi:MAG: ATP-binding cassette domain-containing protein [Proteobacteria bacterium]|nr:ATP-binding cassette domain-containing protein [Pseudomonadota bacterium]
MNVEISNLSKYFTDRVILSEINLSLSSGEIIGLYGPSGSGKSVLLKLLGKVLEPSSGEVKFTGVEEPKIGFLFQEGALFDSMSVLENVAFPLISGADKPDISREEVYQRAYNILSEVGLAKAYEKMSGQLSGGMRRRVALARALVNEPQLVLLDDPTGGLDPVASSVIIDLIKNLHARTKPTVVMVSHDIRRLLPNIHRAIGLFAGKIVADCAPNKITEKVSPQVLDFLKTRFNFSEISLGS